MEERICDCKIKLTEQEEGYTLEVKGAEVKSRIKGCLEQAKRWIEMCCKGEKSPFGDFTSCCK